MARRDVDKVERIAVIGAGTIGASWAAYFLSRAMDVRVWDPDPETESRVRALVARAWPLFERLGLAPGAEQDRISFYDDAQAACRESDVRLAGVAEGRLSACLRWRELNGAAGLAP